MSGIPLDLLACPQCGAGPVVQTGDDRSCAACATRFPSLDGIPWLLPEPQAALGEWRERLHRLVLELDRDAARVRAELENTGLRTATRRRTSADASKLTGNVVLTVTNRDASKPCEVIIKDQAYGAEPIRQTIPPGSAPTRIVVNTNRSQGWYDFSLLVPGYEQFEKRHAGRVETGAEGITDPYMGRLV